MDIDTAKIVRHFKGHRAAITAAVSSIIFLAKFHENEI